MLVVPRVMTFRAWLFRSLPPFFDVSKIVHGATVTWCASVRDGTRGLGPTVLVCAFAAASRTAFGTTGGLPPVVKPIALAKVAPLMASAVAATMAMAVLVRSFMVVLASR